MGRPFERLRPNQQDTGPTELVDRSLPHEHPSVDDAHPVAHLLDLGHEVELWVPGRRTGLTWEQLADHYGLRQPFPIHWIPSAPGLRRYDFAVRAVLAARRVGPDLVYAWPLQAAALAARLGMPTLLEVHDLPSGRMGPRLFRTYLHAAGRRRMLVVTRALRDQLALAYPLPEAAGFVVTACNGVDLAPYEGLPDPDTARERLGLERGFTAGYTGHLYAGRGIELLADLARRNPGLRFILAGGEPGAVAAWQHRLAQDGVGNLRLLGFVPNARLPLVQAACDVLLMPYGRRIAVSGGGDTSGVASPMKAFEYLAAGRPILASDLPVFREVLGEANAVLLPPEDLDAWEAALRGLAADPRRRDRLAAQARKDAAHHTWVERERRALAGLGRESEAA